MSREQDLRAAFIEFADTLIDEYDVVEFLHRLAERCVELVGVSEAGIMLSDRDGTLRYVASSSERMRLIELFELQQNEGPCVDAFRTGEAVQSVLAADSDWRWPNLAPRVREVGFASIAALPMRLRNQLIGVLNLFSTNPEVLTVENQEVAQALADIATIGILQERAVSDAHVVTTQLEAALESRVVIEQAKGIVAERNLVSVDIAFGMLRTYARTQNHRLNQTAQDVIDGTLPANALIDAAARPSPPVDRAS